MPGFTAIKAPAAPVKDGFHSAAESHFLRRTRSATKATVVQDSKTVASEYLGRGNPDISTAEVREASGASQDPGAKKTSTSSKRRASATSSQKNAKRRKTNDVAAGMAVTKPISKAKHKSTATSTSSGTVGIEDTAASHSSNLSFVTAPEISQQSNSLSVTALGHPPQMVSVVVAPTSMHSLQSSSPRTSVDAVRSSGRSTTVYQGQTPRVEKQSSRLQPPRDPLQRTRQNEVRTNARNFRSQRTKKAASNIPSYKNEQPQATVESHMLVPQLTSSTKLCPVTSRVTRSTKRTGLNQANLPESTVTTRTLSEEFIGEDDDDGFLEAIDAANATSVVSEKHLQRKGSLSNEATQTTIPISNKPTQGSSRQNKRPKRKPTPILGPEDEFTQLCEDDDVVFNETTDTVEEYNFKRSPTPTHRDKRLNLRDVDANEDYGGALLSDTDRQILAQLKSSQSSDSKPVILRKPFPVPILDRSPIFGATNTTTLRTCFRLGEALNVGSNAVRTNTNVILELYARVSESWREGRKQFFVFRDLYHDNPPWLEGTFELWGQSVLWDLDSKSFVNAKNVKEGIMCRLIGKMKKDVEKGDVGKVKYRLEVLSIWQAEWEDVDYVAGIYARE